LLPCSLTIYKIVLQPDTLHDLSRLIMAELRRLTFQVSEEEVARARNQVDGSDLIFLQYIACILAVYILF